MDFLRFMLLDLSLHTTTFFLRVPIRNARVLSWRLSQTKGKHRLVCGILYTTCQGTKSRVKDSDCQSSS